MAKLQLGVNDLVSVRPVLAAQLVNPSEGETVTTWGSSLPQEEKIATDGELDEVIAYFLNQADLNTHIETYLANPSQAMRERLLARIENEDFLIQREIVKAENMPSELLDHFSRNGSQFADVRMSVAINPSTAPETLTRLAEDEDSMVRWSVAHNPNTPTETLTYLSKDVNKTVRVFVAKNLNTTTETLTRLARDTTEDVRFSVAQNSSTPTEVLTHLSKSMVWSIRWGVAANLNTAPEVLARLKKDEHVSVKMYAAEALEKREREMEASP